MSQHIGKTKECNKVFSILVQSKEVQMLLESKLRGPRTRAAIASLLADADDDEDDATVAMSLGDEEMVLHDLKSCKTISHPHRYDHTCS